MITDFSVTATVDAAALNREWGFSRKETKRVIARHRINEHVVHHRLYVGENHLAIGSKVRQLIKDYVNGLNPSTYGQEIYKKIYLQYELGNIQDLGITFAPLNVSTSVPDKRLFNVARPVIKNGVVVDIEFDGAQPNSTIYSNYVMVPATGTRTYQEIVQELILKELRRIYLQEAAMLKDDVFSPTMKNLIKDVEKAVARLKARKYAESVVMAKADHSKIANLIEDTMSYFKDCVLPRLSRRFALIELLADKAGALEWWTEADMAEAFANGLFTDTPFKIWYEVYSVKATIGERKSKTLPRFKLATGTDQKCTYTAWEKLEPHPIMKQPSFTYGINGIFGATTLAPMLFSESDIILTGGSNRVRNAELTRDGAPLDEGKQGGVGKYKPIAGEGETSDSFSAPSFEDNVEIMAEETARVEDQIKVIESPWVVTPNAAITKTIATLNSLKPTLLTVSSAKDGSTNKILILPGAGMDMKVIQRISQIKRVKATEDNTVEGYTYNVIGKAMTELRSQNFKYTYTEDPEILSITFNSLVS